MQKMQSKGKNTRKKKDDFSKDYACPCGKNYQSYPAAYTHVKNKHNLEEQFLKNIKKPNREHMQRGRPKDKKENSHTIQTALLTLIQSAILKISTALQATFSKTILQGNQQRNEETFNHHLEQLLNDKRGSLTRYKLQPNMECSQLINELNKDFTAQIACRIHLSVLIIFQLIESMHEDSITNWLDSLQLWNGSNNVNKIIIETYKEWYKLQLEIT